MVLLLIAACDEDGGSDAARARAREFLRNHPEGTAMVSVNTRGAGLDAVVGSHWEGTDLREWLAICGIPAADFEAELEVGPGNFPWPLTPTDPDNRVSTCVWDRLARFPFDGPSRRGDENLVLVRWRPTEAGDGSERHEDSSEGLPRGALAQVPPYYRFGEGVQWSGLQVDGGDVRFKVEEGPIEAGPLPDPAAWAEHLRCEAEDRDLVRTALVFEHGEVTEVGTTPETSCVADAARAAEEWARTQVIRRPEDGDPDAPTTVGGFNHLLVVIDVPVGAW